jgi:hypothetical protein
MASVAAAAGPTDGTGADPALAVAARYIRWSDREVILAQLQSEYLRDIAQSWYPVAGSPSDPPTDREVILAQLESEYLRDIAGSWYPAAIDNTSAADRDDDALGRPDDE